MIDLFTFENLIKAVEFLFKIGSEFEASEQAQRQRIGQWLAELGMLIESVAMDLEHNMFPYSSCAKMNYMVDNFSLVVGSSIKPAERQELFMMLQNARNIERLVGELNQLDIIDKDNKLAKLKQIAGTLQGVGSVLATR